MNGSTAAVPDNGDVGFRLHPTAQGRIYGPYIQTDRFRFGTVTAGSNAVTSFTQTSSSKWDDTKMVLADRYGNAILYFPANTAAAPASAFIGNYTPGSPTSPLPVYNYGDNATYLAKATGISQLTGKMFAYRLGNLSAGSAAPWTIKAGETAVVTPYLLWSAGPDGQFGPPLNSSNTTSGEDDDIVYPDQVLAIPAMQTP
jgi:hypothetical protein